MLFHKIEPNENVDLLAWENESGAFQLGFRRMAYGVRVSLSSVHGMGYDLDYCVGTNGLDAVILFAALWQSLACIDEGVGFYQALRAKFPYQQRKPIDQDPQCKAVLLNLCAETIKRYGKVEMPDLTVVEQDLEAAFKLSALTYSLCLGSTLGDRYLDLPLEIEARSL